MKSKQYELKDTPVYTQVFPDLLLIGVLHENLPKTLYNQKKDKFKSTIHALNQVFFESDARGAKLHDQTHTLTYERIAHQIAKQKYFMDEQANYSAMMEECGVSRQLFMMFRVLDILPKLIQTSRNDQIVRNGISHYLNLTKDDYYQFRDEDIVLLEKNIDSLILELFSNISLAEKCYTLIKHEFNAYLAYTRDFLIYAPQLKAAEKLPGKKGAILGANHVPPLEKLLHSGTNTPIIPWPAHVLTLSSELQEINTYLENFVKGHLQR